MPLDYEKLKGKALPMSPRELENKVIWRESVRILGKNKKKERERERVLWIIWAILYLSSLVMDDIMLVYR